MYKDKVTFCSESHKKHNCNVISIQYFWRLNLAVSKSDGRLYKVNVTHGPNSHYINLFTAII
jgi:hypothetical protein